MLSVLGHISLGILGGSSYVLCFESDGHVAVERAGYDYDILIPRCLDQVVKSKAISDGSKPLCSDILIEDDGDDLGLHLPFKTISDLGWLPLDLLFFVLILFRKSSVTVFRSHRPPFLDSRVAYRRSTVLQI